MNRTVTGDNEIVDKTRWLFTEKLLEVYSILC